ncbi:Transcription factor E2F/dimerization partner (TDP) [Trachipleistophora hominis]|uniref:Transcription factor E2F/dimerization partner (TDP) n=1 Tax=Trachipleistophora hominis TaxID=72359 RepID=L7JXT9_TRAHO|nr:Transcription factor E2F/dimerization partner (TDP) [Trachipleistophora hominis]
MPMAPVSSERLSSSRLENSLFVLTKKFFIYLKQVYPRAIDTNDLSHYLCVSKRRVYDITNILEGLGLLRKRSVNSLEWIGGDFNNFIAAEGEERVGGEVIDDLEKENVNNLFKNRYDSGSSAIDQLNKEEKELDQKIFIMNNKIQNMLQLDSSIKNAYVTHKDLLGLPSLQNKLIFAVKAPQETFLENKDTKNEYMMEFNANSDQIDVFYVSSENDKKK